MRGQIRFMGRNPEKIGPIHLPDTEEGVLCPHSLQGSSGKRVLMEKPAKLLLFS